MFDPLLRNVIKWSGTPWKILQKTLKNPNVTCISESCIEIKIKLNFYFHTFCGDSEGFLKAFKVFIKPFEAPERSVKIKT